MTNCDGTAGDGIMTGNAVLLVAYMQVEMLASL